MNPLSILLCSPSIVRLTQNPRERDPRTSNDGLLTARVHGKGVALGCESALAAGAEDEEGKEGDDEETGYYASDDGCRRG
jgi:hypothetical protein